MKLLPTQVDDAGWLSSQPRAALFSEMGTGKTLTALEAARLVDRYPVLIVCPPIAVGMWCAEAERHLGVSVQRIKTAKDTLDGSAVVVVSEALIARMQATLSEHEWAGWQVVIVDEAHAYKHVMAGRTKALYGGGATMRRCITKDAPYIWIMTGTPVTRWPDDLYPHFRALKPSLIPSRVEPGTPMKLEEFQERYCIVGWQTREMTFADGTVNDITTRVIEGSLNEAELKGLLEKFSRRRTLREIDPLFPPLVTDQEDLDIRPEAIRAAIAICPELKRAIADYQGGELSALELAAVLWSLDGEHLATARRELAFLKLDGVVARLAREFKDDDGAEADPILVFGWHPEFLTEVGRRLSRLDFGEPPTAWNLAVRVVTGATGQRERERTVEMFNKGQLDVLIGNMQALGVSANLQAQCNRVFIAEPDWSWKNIIQAIKRVHRLGQERPCRATFLVSPDTTDDAVVSIARDKMATMEQLGLLEK